MLNIQQLDRWRSAQPGESAEVLWLNGMPGVGKSTISAFLVELLQQLYPDSVVLYFFCKNGDPKLMNTRNIVETFAHQLMEKVPQVRYDLMLLQGNGFSVEQSTIIQLVAKLLQEPVSKHVTDLFMIVDGLDECQVVPSKDGSPSSMVDFLNCLKEIPRSKLLVTSRRTPDISSVLSSYSTKCIGSAENAVDIGVYVENRIASSNLLSRGFSAMELNAVQYIQSRSDGIFLWAVLVMFEAERATSTKAFKKALENLPSGLDRVYETILERLSAEGYGECMREVLLWTLGAQRDLDVQELQTVVEAKLDDNFLDFSEFLQTHAGSLVQIVTERRRVRLLHDSLRDFITNSALCKTEFFVCPTSIQKYLAIACLRYLSNCERSTDFSRYAAQYWIEHLRRIDVGTVDDLDVLVELYKFLHDTGAVNWVREELNAPQWYDFRTTYIHHIVDWLFSWFQKIQIPEGSKRDAEVREWLSDVLASGMGSLHRCFRQAIGKCWFHGKLKEWHQIKRCFLTGIECHKVARDSNSENFDWDSWFVDVSAFWTSDRITVEEVLSFAHEFDYNDADGECVANVGVALQRDFPDDAIKYYELAIAKKPAEARYYVWLGECFEGKELVDDALRVYKEGMVRDLDGAADTSRMYWKLRGKSCSTRGDLDGAIEAYKTAISIDPSNAGINKGNYYESLGEIYVKKGDFESASEIYRIASKEDSDWRSHYWDAFAQMYKNDWKTKARVFLLAIENTTDKMLKTRYRSGWAGIGKDFLFHNDFTHAKLALEDALESDPDGRGYYLEPLGQTCLCIQEWDNAVRYYEALLKCESTGSAWTGLAMAYMGKERYDKTEECCQHVLEMQSNRPSTWAQQLLFEAYIAQGKYEAVRDICSLWRSSPNVSKWDNKDAEFLYDVGWFYEQDGDLLKAERNYELATGLYEDVCAENWKLMESEEAVWEHHGRFAYYLGLIYEKLKKLDKARSWLERAAWIYKLAVGDDNELTKEVIRSLDQLSSDGCQEDVLPWRVRKERARLSEFRSCWAVHARELAKETVRTDWQKQFKEDARQNALRQLANRNGAWRYLEQREQGYVI